MPQHRFPARFGGRPPQLRIVAEVKPQRVPAHDVIEAGSLQVMFRDRGESNRLSIRRGLETARPEVALDTATGGNQLNRPLVREVPTGAGDRMA